MILEQLFQERNSSKSTQVTYTRSCRYYEKLTGHSIKECLDIADDEEYNNIRWKNTQTRKWILAYREWLYGKYNISTAQLYLTAIITIYRHFEITIPPLPYFSKKGLRHSTPINYEDLPDRDLLREVLQGVSPLARSLILFMSSSGISRIDVLNLTIADYLDATKEYHNADSVKKAIKEMRDTDIIPTFHLTRQKTGLDYFTFCSHEAVKSINAYLLTRTEILTRERPLFKLHERYINIIFERLNDDFQLGKVGNYNRLRPHMLRKYHASQLAEAGMSTDHINLLQGRKVNGVAHEHYIRIKPETLREEYIEALPYLVIEDVNQYKTENQQLREENEHYKNNLDDLWEELNNMKKRTDIWEEMKQ
jgi:integrase